jgi:hypothetical protein
MSINAREDAPVAPARRRLVDFRLSSDRMLTGAGILIAIASASFPWYVFFNEDKFGIRVTPMELTRDLPEGPPRPVFSVSPMALVDNDDKTTPPDKMLEPLDTLTTATVTKPDRGRQTDSALPPDQPFPGGNSFRLMHVANGRALIQDNSGMYMVRVGSILPDNSRLAVIEKRNGKWVIITSTGEIYDDAAASGP